MGILIVYRNFILLVHCGLGLGRIAVVEQAVPEAFTLG
jgi:hypothetical protein